MTPPSSETQADSTPPRRARWLRWVLAVLAVLLLLPVGAWWWASSPGSLARALQLAQRFLPEGQELRSGEVTGSITGGGNIGHLQWSKPGIALTIDGLRLDWSLGELFGRALNVRTLEAGNVRVRLTPQPGLPAEPDQPFTMPADVSLPIRISLPLRVSRVQVETVDEAGSTSMQLIEDVALNYGYDGMEHALRLDRLRYGASTAQADLHLHARTLALRAEASASLRDLVPDAPLAMRAQLQADGTLAGGAAAELALRVDAGEVNGDATPLQQGARLLAQATVNPWREQPLQQLRLEASRLNAHAFHGQAPVTAFHGEATVLPVAGATSSWDLAVDFANDAPGAWGERLPLRVLTARGQLAGEQLDIAMAHVELAGTRPAGDVNLAGRLQLGDPLRSTLQLVLQRLDLQPLMQGLPRTAFSGEASIAPPPTGAAAGDAAGWQARADIRNAVPGQLDRERLPLDRLLADVRGTADRWRAETLQLQVGTGRLQAQGEFQPRTQVLQARAQLQRLPLARIHGKFADGAAAVLSGTLAARGDLRQGVDFDADIAGGAAPDTTRAAWEIRAVQANGRWSPSRLAVERIHVDALRARIDGSDIDVALPDLASIKARVTATAPGVAFDADAAMLQRSGGGRLSLQLSSAEQLAAWLEGLPVIGEQLPRLRATGLANLQADWQGGWRQWADGFSHPSRYPQLRLNAGIDADALHVEMPAQAEGADPFRIDVQGLHARLQGNLALASLALDGDVRANDTRATLDIRAQLVQAAGNSRTPQWNATVERFAVAATLPKQSDPWRLRVAEGLQLSVQAGDELALRTSAGSATLLPPAGIATGDAPLELAWQPLSLSRTASGATRLQSTGSVRGIQPGWIDALLAPEGEGPLAGNGMGTDLRISGEWAIDLSERLDIRARLQRDSGDAWLVEPAIGSSDASANAAARKGTVAGIRTFDVRLQSENEDVALALNWDTERAGVITANVRTRLAREIGGWRLPEAAPLSGNVKARLQDLGAWGVFAPPGWRVRGELDSNVTLAGTVQSPQLQGGIEARGLNIRSALDGVDLYDGSLRATLEGQRLNIVELTLQGGTGSHAYVRGLSGNRTQPPTARGRMVASGTIDWSGVGRAAQGSGIAMDLRASLQQMQVLVRNDRQLSLSGDLTAGLQQGALRVRGDIKVDRASITLPDASAPTLGDDVHVVRAGDRPAAAADEPEARGELNTARPMDLEIKLDLGRDLALQGQGITTRLQGGLTVRSGEGGGDPFRVVGEVRTDEGRYRAWGQALNVETGVVLFNGPYDNPSLNLLAIRPEIDVRAGVRVTGTLLAPRVQLYSEPELPEAEKLSWVVLGRATATTNAEGSNMQQAALGLLANQVGGSLANGLGFDEIGLAESGVSVGKRLSDELYVTYERGLAGAASTLYLFYDITRRFTVRGQTGEASAVDLIYTITYD